MAQKKSVEGHPAAESDAAGVGGSPTGRPRSGPTTMVSMFTIYKSLCTQCCHHRIEVLGARPVRHSPARPPGGAEAGVEGRAGAQPGRRGHDEGLGRPRGRAMVTARPPGTRARRAAARAPPPPSPEASATSPSRTRASVASRRTATAHRATPDLSKERYRLKLIHRTAKILFQR